MRSYPELKQILEYWEQGMSKNGSVHSSVFLLQRSAIVFIAMVR